jgi:uncharacterized protein (TIGR04255 family)
MNMSYKQNFLDRVIVRCDLLEDWGIKEECPIELRLKLAKICPIIQEKTRQHTSITIDQVAQKTSENIHTTKEWVFTNPEKGVSVSLAHDYFGIEYTRYVSITDLIDLLNKITPLLESHFGTFILKRIGIRFIDIFTFGNEDPLSWEKYITSEYLVTTDKLPPVADREYLSRAFNRMEYTYPDEMQVIINYGIHNPSYPAPIRLRQYILDTDIQSLGVVRSKDLREKIEIFQEKANKIFESAITDEVRGLMNE